jgi:aerobactin synthase
VNHWTQVNHALIAKSISELHFEEVISLTEELRGQFRLDLKRGPRYQFLGRRSAWGHVWVDADSLTREHKGESSSELNAAQFFIDSVSETGMSEITLANFLEELHQTLYSDLAIAEKPHATASEIVQLGGESLQHQLSGHPKLLLNKGRLGWGPSDLEQYAPEHAGKFQLHWILVNKSSLRGSSQNSWSMTQVLEQSFQGSELESISSKLSLYSSSDYDLLPVHPWQWERVIRVQFQDEIQNKNIIDLGTGGDFYTPQVSIRTLANADRPKNLDLKLPLSILNTSCVRGLPHRYLPLTPLLSQKLTQLCESDEYLRARPVSVLGEASAWGYQHPQFHQVDGAPYRYHEHLGAVWRESVQSKIKDNEQGILTAALFHTDKNKVPLVVEYARASGLSLTEWMKKYAQHVILPLYHLQLKHGIGLVSHGQNIVVRLKGSVPSGLILKDFHGDLRLSSSHLKEHENNFGSLSDSLTHLPPEHLIHDLITGHFVTVLRFLAGSLETSGAMTEADFYKTLSQEISTYKEVAIPENVDLLARTFKRVLVNKVRFKIGYSDSAERPLPMLGSELKNPLFTGSHL